MTPTKTMDSNQHFTTLSGTHKFKKSGVSLDIKVETVNMAAYCHRIPTCIWNKQNRKVLLISDTSYIDMLQVIQLPIL